MLLLPLEQRLRGMEQVFRNCLPWTVVLSRNRYCLCFNFADVIESLRQQIELTLQQDPFVISQTSADGSVPLSVIQQVT